ncbi:MAG: trehalose 2-sulfotransferase, partial [Acidimicrobiaceae bacterium]
MPRDCPRYKRQDVVLPAKAYLICANQRSGSTLLCRALSDTGVAGNPMEYFLTGGPDDFPLGWTFWEQGALAKERGVRTREEFLQLVYEVGSTDNGIFGAKLMWNNVRWVLVKFNEMARFSGMTRVEVFAAAFPDLHVIHLTRRDRVRQAVSWARAAQDGVWVVSDEEPAQPVGNPSYVFDFIAGLEGL